MTMHARPPLREAPSASRSTPPETIFGDASDHLADQVAALGLVVETAAEVWG